MGIQAVLLGTLIKGGRNAHKGTKKTSPKLRSSMSCWCGQQQIHENTNYSNKFTQIPLGVMKLKIEPSLPATADGREHVIYFSVSWKWVPNIEFSLKPVELHVRLQSSFNKNSTCLSAFSFARTNNWLCSVSGFPLTTMGWTRRCAMTHAMDSQLIWILQSSARWALRTTPLMLPDVPIQNSRFTVWGEKSLMPPRAWGWGREKWLTSSLQFYAE